MLVKPLQEITKDSIDTFDLDFVLSRKPVLIKGGASDWLALKTCTINRLRDRFGHLTVPIRNSDNERTMTFGDSKSNSTSPGMRTLELASYIDLITQPTTSEKRPPYAANISLKYDQALGKDLSVVIEECDFEKLMTSDHYDDFRLWVAAGGQKSTIHNDPAHNFNVQIEGVKRFLVFAPDQHNSIYAHFIHPGLWASPIDPYNPDTTRYPDFNTAEGFECTLHSGDVLYLPKYWWHCAEADTTCVNVNRWVFDRQKDNWWHLQPIAKKFISYEKLLKQTRSAYATLPEIMKQQIRPQQMALESELEGLLKEQGK